MSQQKPLCPEMEAKLRESFRRNSPETIEAILKYRREGDVSAVIVAVHGIIERYLTAEHSTPLAHRSNSLRLGDELGLDSLTMLEIVMSIEEALDIRIDDKDARNIRTLGDVRCYVDDRVNNRPVRLAEIKPYSRDQILLVLPQQMPFMFLDSAEIQGQTVRANYLFKGDEFFFSGHFKDSPVVPASIVCEALGQAGCLWLVECVQQELSLDIHIKDLLFVGMEALRFHKRLLPGDQIQIDLQLTRIRSPLAVFEGTVKAGGQLVARLESLTLAFGELPDETFHQQPHSQPAVSSKA